MKKLILINADGRIVSSRELPERMARDMARKMNRAVLMEPDVPWFRAMVVDK